MEHRSVVIRRHALFKRQYRRVIAAVGDFHSLPPEAQREHLRADEDEQHESGGWQDRHGRGGFDRDQPSEVAGAPIHQGGQRMGENRSLQSKNRERDAIPPESPR